MQGRKRADEIEHFHSGSFLRTLSSFLHTSASSAGSSCTARFFRLNTSKKGAHFCHLRCAGGAQEVCGELPRLELPPASSTVSPGAAALQRTAGGTPRAAPPPRTAPFLSRPPAHARCVPRLGGSPVLCLGCGRVCASLERARVPRVGVFRYIGTKRLM